jgi:hypothetical protein
VNDLFTLLRLRQETLLPALAPGPDPSLKRPVPGGDGAIPPSPRLSSSCTARTDDARGAGPGREAVLLSPELLEESIFPFIVKEDIPKTVSSLGCVCKPWHAVSSLGRWWQPIVERYSLW